MSQINIINETLGNLFRLVFPVYCQSCGSNLHTGEDSLCSHCEYQLPVTNFHLENDNPVEAIFWGRIELNAAASFLYYQKGEMVQHLIHQLKYHNKPEIGIYLGKLFGQYLMQSQRFANAQYIIPVPLHWKKKKKRGYNQSEKIADGLAIGMEAEKDIKSLVRKVHTSTQTKKSRYERWENVSSIFSLSQQAKQLEKRHVILVDDVITTGATIEACFATLDKIPEIKISVVSLACPLI